MLQRLIAFGTRTLKVLAALTLSLAIAVQPSSASFRSAEGIGEFVRGELAKTEIPGASIAVIHDGRVVWSRGIGVADKSSGRAVDERTLFQAASISKAFSALAALRLVEAGKLSLDGDVNDILQGWKVRDADGKLVAGVTLRMLLSHTAGTSVSGLRGYNPGEPVPTLPQILEGLAPANNRAIRVVTPPGSAWRYSGGGYLVLQQLIEQVTGESMADHLNRTLLRPLGMRDSVFAQPLPATLRARAARGYLDDGTPVPGGARTYPETAAAALWTTAGDLAKFVLALQRGVNGRAGGLLSQQMLKAALQDQRNHMGLGLFLQSQGPSLRFHHGGRNQGFDSEMVGYAGQGDGAIILVNANDSSGMIDRILQHIGELYDWPDYPRPYYPRLSDGPGRVPGDIQGHYENPNGRLITILQVRGATMVRQGVGRGAYYDRLIGAGTDLIALDHPDTYHVIRDTAGRVTAVERSRAGDPDKRHFPRIGSLAERAAVDPDPQLTASVLATLRELAVARSSPPIMPSIASGFSRDIGTLVLTELSPISGLRFAGEQVVAAQSINRHDTPVMRTRTYLLDGPATSGAIIVYFDAADRICDYDLVEK
jgi:CubicO group peptidase (beta-lactamase class C family)